MDKREFTLEDFNYELPADRIAQVPCDQREGARLLHRSSNGQMTIGQVKDLPELLPAGSLVVVNNSRVIAGRLQGTFASGGRCEVFLLHAPQGSEQAQLQCFASPVRKLKEGKELFFAAGLVARVLKREDASAEHAGPPLIGFAFNCSGDELRQWLQKHGSIPLPPYIKRAVGEAGPQSADSARYQTVYAQTDGSVAAPTAGLHFSEEILERLEAKGITVAPVTLHVGAGTFLPVKSQKLAEHAMHREHYSVPRATLNALLQARAEKRPIILVGTTTLRCLESFFISAGRDIARVEELADRWLSTELFIYPRTPEDRHRPWIGDALMTNFHQPCSTLYMLVCALIGYRETAATYRYALEQGFRFLSYGDASLLEFDRL